MSKARPIIRASERSGSNSGATSWPPCCCRRACRCCSAATSSAARQRGNNNAYCQDNEISWVDWSLARRPEDLSEFVAALCRLRLATPVLRRTRFFREDEIVWLRPDAQPMTAADWNAPSARAITIAGPQGEHVLLINGCAEPVTFRLPDAVQNARMAVLLDTSVAHVPGSEVRGDVPLAGRSLMMLERG